MGGPNSGRVSKKWTPEILDVLAEELDLWCKRKGSLWLGDFCREFDVPTKDFQEIFSREAKSLRAYERAKDWQESVFVKGGLLKKFDSGMTKFMLSNCCGYAEKTKVEGELGFVLQGLDGMTKDLTKK